MLFYVHIYDIFFLTLTNYIFFLIPLSQTFFKCFFQEEEGLLEEVHQDRRLEGSGRQDVRRIKEVEPHEVEIGQNRTSTRMHVYLDITCIVGSHIGYQL